MEKNLKDLLQNSDNNQADDDDLLHIALLHLLSCSIYAAMLAPSWKIIHCGGTCCSSMILSQSQNIKILKTDEEASS